MMPNGFATIPNPDLVVAGGGRTHWNTAEQRRRGYHNLHRNVLYGLSLRARHVLPLRRDIDRRIADMPAVRALTGSAIFSAMAVARGDTLLYERYAPDFGPDRPHSIQSITKTMNHLLLGQLVEQGLVDLDDKVRDHLPEIGTGYADATLRDVFDMNVANDYTEDYSDLETTASLHEVVMGWRLPGAGEADVTNRDFICRIESDDIVNRGPEPLYKSANADVLAWVAERVSGRSLYEQLIDIVEAAGLEHTFYMSTDRDGLPSLNGGASMTARDLARYGLLFARGGVGVNGKTVGSRAFIDEARSGAAKPYPPPREWLRYCRHLQTNGRWVGHDGHAGQYMMADPESGVAVAFFSVLEDESGDDPDYNGAVTLMCQAITELPFDAP